MKATALVSALLLLFGQMDVAVATEAHRAKMRVQIVSDTRSSSTTIIFDLEEGEENLFGKNFPKIKVVVLPQESDQLPIQISLLAENGQTLSSTIVHITPETSAEFSLDSEGIEAQGMVTHL